MSEMSPPVPDLPRPPPEDRVDALGRIAPFAPAPGTLVPDARAFLAASRGALRELHARGEAAKSVVRGLSAMIDTLLRGLLDKMVEPGTPPFAVIALGGYGRRELAPFSDVDVLLLHEGEGGAPGQVAALAERLLYALWDLKLEVGWGVRTTAECAALAERDHTARTALLDCRLVAGDERLARGLEARVLGELLGRHADQFIADKVEELRRRRLKYGETVYLLEPNVKQGEGGARDLQAALWIARARFRAAGLGDLLHRSVLPPSEVEELRVARNFLWRVRNEMHWGAGRKEDRLTFDVQERVARELGYRDGPEGLAVEQFMRHFYLAASSIKRAADALVSRCEESARRAPPRERRLDHELKVWNGRLTLCSSDLFERDPGAIARVFAVADREGIPLHSWARDRASQELWRVTEEVRSSPEVAATIRQMFVRPGTRGEFLRSMHELRALGAFIPEFARVTARAIHDVYHVYTVDLHCIFVAMKLYALRNGEYAESEPALTRLAQSLTRPLPLYLAALMHDVGKGGGSGHAERGARLTRTAAARLQLAPEDVEDACALVEKHLLMSHVSQRRDLSDRDLIASFAGSVGDAERLLMLYLLTWADMSSVAPGTWTSWKARLLEELYLKARAFLEGSARDDLGVLRGNLREALAGRAPAEEASRFIASLPERYLRSVDARSAGLHLRLLRRGKGKPLAAALFHRGEHTELTLAAPDRPGLLALFSGALAAHRVDIMRAEIYSTSDGWALDVFAVRGPHGRLEHDRWKAARADLVAALEGRLDVGQLLARRHPRGLRERFAPRVETHVSVDPQAAADATVFDIYAQDRIGLLHTIARTLFEEGIEIFLAKVATEGNRAADGFYVRKGGKKISDPETLARAEAALRRALG